MWEYWLGQLVSPKYTKDKFIKVFYCINTPWFIVTLLNLDIITKRPLPHSDVNNDYPVYWQLVQEQFSQLSQESTKYALAHAEP